MKLRTAGPAWLFCPADRPERFAKAAAAADVVILDLEDGVAEAQKPAARQALLDTPLDPERTIVRINAGDTDEQARDLAALAGTAYTTVMLPKAESVAQLALLAPRDVIALVETARGALFAAEIAAADNTVGMMWGAEDLIATLGGSSSRRGDGTYRDVARHVRSTILLAASAFGRLALDAVHLDIGDVDGLHAEAIDAATVGFDVTVCVHPPQPGRGGAQGVSPRRREAGLGAACARRSTHRAGCVRVRRADGRLPGAQARGNAAAAGRGIRPRVTVADFTPVVLDGAAARPVILGDRRWGDTAARISQSPRRLRV